MPEPRARTTLGALGTLVIGKTPRTDDPDQFGGPVPFITPVDIDGRRTITTTARTLSPAGARSVAAARAPRGAVLITCIGSDLGKVALAGADAITNQQIASLVVHSPHHALYIYYELLARRHELRAAAGGSAQPILTRDSLARLPIDLPAPDRQRALARVPGALDDKLELNADLCATLTEIAEARFHDLFVAFTNSPAARVDSELGPIPPDFSVMRMGQLVTLDKGLSYRGRLLGAVGRPLLGLGDFAARTVTAPRRYSGRHLDRHLVAPGDLLLAAADLSQRRELLGAPLLAPDLDAPAPDSGDDTSPAASAPAGDRALLFSQHVYAVRLRADGEGWREFLYFALRQPAFRARAAAFATGTTVLALPRDAVLQHALVVPPARLRAEFAAFARPLLERIELARRESRDLARLRDCVLPGLISGALTPPALGGPRATP